LLTEKLFYKTKNKYIEWRTPLQILYMLKPGGKLVSLLSRVKLLTVGSSTSDKSGTHIGRRNICCNWCRVDSVCIIEHELIRLVKLILITICLAGMTHAIYSREHNELTNPSCIQVIQIWTFLQNWHFYKNYISTSFVIILN